MWRRRIFYALALLCTLLGQIFDIGYLFHYMFILTLALPLLGLALSLPAMLGLRVRLEAKAAVVERDHPAGWDLVFANRVPLPLARLTCRVRLHNRLTGEGRRFRAAERGVAPRGQMSWLVDTCHCGLVECRADWLWVCDCLGLFALPVRVPAPGTLLIGPVPRHPGTVSLPEGVGIPCPVPKGKSASGEEYELRSYQAGDSMRAIHWKMSAKRDELVTRELLEDKRPLLVLTFDHFGPLDALDRTLDCLAGYSQALLDRQRPHEIRWAHPETGVVRRYAVSCRREWTTCLAAVLSDPAPLQGHSILENPLTVEQDMVLHSIHITGEEADHEA